MEKCYYVVAYNILLNKNRSKLCYYSSIIWQMRIPNWVNINYVFDKIVKSVNIYIHIPSVLVMLTPCDCQQGKYIFSPCESERAFLLGLCFLKNRLSFLLNLRQVILVFPFLLMLLIFVTLWCQGRCVLNINVYIIIHVIHLIVNIVFLFICF